MDDFERIDVELHRLTTEIRELKKQRLELHMLGLYTFLGQSGAIVYWVNDQYYDDESYFPVKKDISIKLANTDKPAITFSEQSDLSDGLASLEYWLESEFNELDIDEDEDPNGPVFWSMLSEKYGYELNEERLETLVSILDNLVDDRLNDWDEAIETDVIDRASAVYDHNKANMTTIKQNFKQLDELFEEFNVTVLERYIHRGHIHVCCRSPDGREKRFTFSGSHSDYRTFENRRVDMRRWIKGIYK
jgi:hypothetical protein